jgi:hypothetical protein
MRIGDLLSQNDVGVIRPEPQRQDVERTGPGGHNHLSLYGLSRARLQALLPDSGIVVGPPAAEDRLEISPLAHAILRAGVEMDSVESQRVGRLHLAYMGGTWEPDASQTARALIAATVKAQQQADPVPGSSR